MQSNGIISSLYQIIDLLKLTNFEDDTIKHLEPITNDNFATSLNQLTKITQEKWLRPPGKERWDLKDSPLLIAHRDNIISSLEKLGFIYEVKPFVNTYDAVLLLGASDSNLIERINYLEKIWNLGVRFKICYLLTGGMKISHDRLNYFRNENHIHLNSVPTTDTDLIIEVYNQLSSNWPHSLRTIEVIPIITNNKLPRPNTRDTLNAWLERNERMHSLLIISNQPFIPYQNLVAQSVLNTSYQAETIGNHAKLNIPIRIILDSIARYLYECNAKLTVTSQ